MNPIFFVAFLSLGALVSGFALPYSSEDGQWKGEGLSESEDNGQWNDGHDVHVAPISSGAYAQGAAPIGKDGRVVDTPEVAHAKAAHYAAIASASQGPSAHAADSYIPATYTAWSPIQDEGQWKGEGLINSQENIQYNGQYQHYSSHAAAAPLVPAYAPAPAHYASENDGQWKGEGIAESQDLSEHTSYGAPLVHAAYNPVGYSAESDGQWKGEGIAESQDQGENTSHGVSSAHGAAPIGKDGRVVDTPEVAHAKAAHFAAISAAGHVSYGAHGSW